MSRATYWLIAAGRVVEQIGKPSTAGGVATMRLRCVVTGAVLDPTPIAALVPASKRAVTAALATAAARRGAS